MTFNPDAAYAHYMEKKRAGLEAAWPRTDEPPRWEVRFCVPGHDDVTIPYYANESGPMCEALVNQTALGHDTYVRWIK